MMSKREAKEWAKIFNSVFAQDDPQGIEARAMTDVPGFHHVVLMGITVRLTTVFHTGAEARRFLAAIVPNEEEGAK